MFVIFALKDDTNNGVSTGGGNWFPLALFFLIFGLGACFGWETGYAINLARDFGPRLMSYCVGYGSEVWSAGGVSLQSFFFLCSDLLHKCPLPGDNGQKAVSDAG